MENRATIAVASAVSTLAFAAVMGLTCLLSTLTGIALLSRQVGSFLGA